MKHKYFLVTLSFIVSCFLALCASAGCYGEDFSFEYGENGGIQVKNMNGEVVATYDSMDALLIDRFGFVPELTIDMNKFTMASSQNSNGSSKTRGRLIYTVEEAMQVVKDGSVNKVRLRYK